MLKIFIGYDHRQPVNYTVLQQSIIEKATQPVAITPLVLPTLPLKRQGLTPFTFSRFMVPYLCGYQGMALFLDVDELVLGDVAELFACADGVSAVQVVKHTEADLEPGTKLKFEWASVMLFDCGHADNAKLTPEFVETAENLHTISWTDAVGTLPREWNHLVGYDKSKPAKLVHYTQGTPAYPEARLEYVKEWDETARKAYSTVPWVKLMGTSVHARPVVHRLQREGKLKVSA